MSSIERRQLDPALAAITWAASALRVVAVIGLHPYRYVDSIDYETLDFTGNARRPWVAPLLYWFTDNDPTRVVLQAILGALAWLVLAGEVGATMHDRRVRRVAVGAVLALSLTTSITNWDTTILSESVALSATALLAASFLHFGRLRTVAAAGWVAAASLVWIFTRQNHLVLHALIVATAVVVVAVQWWRTRSADRPLLALVGGLVLVGLLAMWSYGHNTEIRRFNLAMVIGQRVITDQENLDWFRDHGMPLPAAATPGQAIFPEPLLADRAFARWVAEDGDSTYTTFLLTHPWDTLTDPLEDFVADRPSYADPPRPDETMLSTAEAYGSARQVLPEPLEEWLFDPGGTGTVMVGLVGVLTATGVRWRRRGWDPRWLVPLLVIGLQWPALTVVWHASTAELGRLALISAVLLRIGLLAQLALLADARLTDPNPVCAADSDPGASASAAGSSSIDVGGEAVGDLGPEVDERVAELGG